MDWNDAATGWDEDEAVRTYARAAFDSLRRAARERDFALAGARVLDFGCGTGLLTEQLAVISGPVVALDPAPKMIAVLDEKTKRLSLPNVHTVAATLAEAQATRPELFAHGFDLVVCSSVCGFLEDYATTARDLVALMAPGGLFVQWDWELDPTAEEPFGLSRAAIEKSLTDAGLAEVNVEIGFEQPFEGETMKPLMGTGVRP